MDLSDKLIPRGQIIGGVGVKSSQYYDTCVGYVKMAKQKDD